MLGLPLASPMEERGELRGRISGLPNASVALSAHLCEPGGRRWGTLRMEIGLAFGELDGRMQ